MTARAHSPTGGWFAGLASRRESAAAAVELDVERRRRRSSPGSLPVWQARPASPVWVLKAQRAGDASQVLALAEALGLPFEVKELARRPFDVALAPPFAASLAGLAEGEAAKLAAPWPDLVLSAGRENEPVARWIRRASGGRTKIVHVGRPWADVDGYDLVVTTPQYRLPERPNVLHNDAPLHRVTPDRLAEAGQAWAPRLGHLPRPRVAVLVGGNSGPYALDRAAGERLGRQASELARRLNGSLMITTSARTPASALAGLASAIDVPHYLFGWKRGGTENPYYAFLNIADEIVVTADSMSMITEACATGKPVHLFDLGEGPLSMRAPLGIDGEVAGPRLDPRRWLREAGLPTAFYRFMLRHSPRRLTRDIRLVHERIVAAGRARWLGEETAAARHRPSADLDRAVARVRALLAHAGSPAAAVLDRAA